MKLGFKKSNYKTHLVDLFVLQLVAVGDVLSAYSVVHVGLDSTRCDSVDGDLLVAEVEGHAADEGLNGSLAAGVDSVLGDTLSLASDAAHHDEAATDLEVLVGLAGDEELATGVDAEDAVELLWRDVLDVAERDDTAVGADNVELAPDLDGLVKQLHDLVHI